MAVKKKPTPIKPKNPNAIKKRPTPIPKPDPPPKPTDLLFKKLVEAGNKQLEDQEYEKAEESFFHARMVGVSLGKTSAEMKATRTGYLKAFSEIIKEAT